MPENEFSFREGANGFYRVWKRIVREPQKFYQEMPVSGGFESPLLYLGICLAVFLVFRILVAETLVSAGVSVFLIVLAYVLGPGILMLVAQSLFHGSGDYEATFRVCAYAGSCLLLAWIPRLGAIAYIYGFYLIFVGMEKVHRLQRTEAALSVLTAVPVTGLVLAFVLGKRVLQYVF
ncbi:MAG TPA: YIP1 family protein [Candidatus Acidoferrales bacterium]|nr:YIP1 family protein [Candidatus Acidoferrales bacterium]